MMNQLILTTHSSTVQILTMTRQWRTSSKRKILPTIMRWMRMVVSYKMIVVREISLHRDWASSDVEKEVGSRLYLLEGVVSLASGIAGKVGVLATWRATGARSFDLGGIQPPHMVAVPAMVHSHKKQNASTSTVQSPVCGMSGKIFQQTGSVQWHAMVVNLER